MVTQKFLIPGTGGWSLSLTESKGNCNGKQSTVRVACLLQDVWPLHYHLWLLCVQHPGNLFPQLGGRPARPDAVIHANAAIGMSVKLLAGKYAGLVTTGLAGLSTTGLAGLAGLSTTGLAGLARLATTGLAGLALLSTTGLAGLSTTGLAGLAGLATTRWAGLTITEFTEQVGLAGLVKTGLTGWAGREAVVLAEKKMQQGALEGQRGLERRADGSSPSVEGPGQELVVCRASVGHMKSSPAKSWCWSCTL